MLVYINDYLFYALFALFALFAGYTRYTRYTRYTATPLIQRVLIVKLSSLGDVVHTVPLFHDLRLAYPRAEIDWVVEEAFVDLLTPLGLSRVIPLGLRRWRKALCRLDFTPLAEGVAFYNHLRQVKYDLIIDAQGLIKSAFVARLAKGGFKGTIVGLANRTIDSGYEPCVRLLYDVQMTVEPKIHAVERSRWLALGRPSTNWPTFYPPGLGLSGSIPLNLKRGRYILFFHATAGAKKRWADSHWMALGQRLNGQGYTVVLPWGTAKERLTSLNLASAIPGAFVPEALSLAEFFPLILNARCTIGIDTGLTHLAAALLCPTVQLYLSTWQWKFRGYWHPGCVNLGDKGLPLTVDDVVQALPRMNSF